MYLVKRKLALALGLVLPASAMAGPALDELEAHWGVLETYCENCHNFEDFAGGVAFDFFDPEHIGEEAEVFEMALKKMRGSVMPPPSQEQPTDGERWSFIDSLENALDEYAAEHPDPGNIVMRRLNRSQYVNAIYDMTGVTLDESVVLPKDDNSDGFDNIAGVLKVSPSFLDQYIMAGRNVAEQAIGDPEPRTETLFFPASTSYQGDHIHGLPPGTRGGNLIEFTAPVDGEYSFTIPDMAGAGYVLGMGYEQNVFITVDGEIVFRESIGGREDLKALDQLQASAVADINSRFDDIRVNLDSGEHEIGFGFVARSFAESDEFLYDFKGNRGMDIAGTDDTRTMGRIVAMRGMEIVGPLNSGGHVDTPSRRKVMICEPEAAAEERDCARQIFARLAKQAFRRPITDDDLQNAMSFYEEGRTLGTFDDGIKYGMTAILSSPKFLFRTEATPSDTTPGQVVEISDLELASRLSFFLWSTNPDEELLTLASEGRLSDDEVLQEQVQRMLADPRSAELVDNFVFLWLRLRDLDDIDPDPEIFPAYRSGLVEDFKREIALFAQEIIREDRPVHDFMTADYSYLNEDLARHYGITDVRGDYFRRVELDQEERFGLLGKGGVQMVTSYANRTTPVIRGAFILEKFAGVPTPTPPMNVPAFPETEEGQKVAQTVRERLEAHRDNPACAGCHDVIDPVGLALENFNTIGQFRERDSDAGNIPIDASGRLASGQEIVGVNDLRNALVDRPDQFAQVFTEFLMTYALGRGVEAHDMPTVRAIVDLAEENDYRVSSIINGIINSDQFRMMTVPETSAAQVGSR